MISDSFETAAQVALAKHLGEVFLSAASGTVDGAVVVAPAAGFAVAAEEDADEPAAPAPSYDLSRLASQRNFPPENLAHRWHTGQRRRYYAINYLGEEMG